MSAAEEPAAKPPRPWWRLHVSTWVVMLLVLLCVAMTVAVGNHTAKSYLPPCEHGWPLVFLRREPLADANGYLQPFSVWWSTGTVTEFDGTALAVDLCVALGMVIALSALAEWRRRRRRGFWQFGLRKALLATLLLAAFFGWVAAEARDTQRQRRALKQLRGYEFDYFYVVWDSRFDWAWEQIREEWYWDQSETGAAPTSTLWLGDVGQLGIYGRDHVEDVLGRLGQFTELQGLEFDCARVSSQRLAVLRRLRRLESLRLQCGVDDAGLAHLADLRDLRDLELGRNPITDAGLVHLKNLTQLEYLDLSYTRITDAGLVHLAGLKRLKFLDLTATQVTPEGIQRLRRTLPDLEVTSPS